MAKQTLYMTPWDVEHEFTDLHGNAVKPHIREERLSKPFWSATKSGVIAVNKSSYIDYHVNKAFAQSNQSWLQRLQTFWVTSRSLCILTSHVDEVLVIGKFKKGSNNASSEKEHESVKFKETGHILHAPFGLISSQR